ncbi:unnamed protein product [Brassica oleracea]
MHIPKEKKVVNLSYRSQFTYWSSSTSVNKRSSNKTASQVISPKNAIDVRTTLTSICHPKAIFRQFYETRIIRTQRLTMTCITHTVISFSSSAP